MLNEDSIDLSVSGREKPEPRTSLRWEIKACLALAIPLAAAQLAQAATGFVDTIMMGMLGSVMLAAGGLGSVAFGMLLFICSGVLSAVSSLVAEAHGAGQRETAGKITAQSLWLCSVLAIPCIMLLACSEPLLRLCGQEVETARLAASYLHAIAWGFWPGLAFVALQDFISALSQARPVMVIVVGGTLLNMAGNYALMFGKFGLPALGLAGIGWASALSLWCMLLAIVLYIHNRPELRAYNVFRHLRHVNRYWFGQIIQIGWPIGILVAVEVGLFTVVTFLMGQLGTTTLAAHQIAFRTASMTFMVPLGIALATTIRVGQQLGQGNRRGAQLAGYVGMGMSGCFMLMMALILWLLPDPVIALYLDVQNPANREVVDLARKLLIVAAMFQFADGIQVTANGALRGLKDTHIPMMIGVFAYWGIGLGSGYWLGIQQHWGGVGLWWGLAMGLMMASVVLFWRFQQKSATIQPEGYGKKQ